MNKLFIFIMNLIAILILVGCNKQGLLELESVNPNVVSFSKYGTGPVPIEVAVRNVGGSPCKIKGVGMYTFWSSPNDARPIEIQQDFELLANQKYIFVLRGHIPSALRVDNIYLSGEKVAPVVFYFVGECRPRSFERIITFVE